MDAGVIPVLVAGEVGGATVLRYSTMKSVTAADRDGPISLQVCRSADAATTAAGTASINKFLHCSDDSLARGLADSPVGTNPEGCAWRAGIVTFGNVSCVESRSPRSGRPLADDVCQPSCQHTKRVLPSERA